MINEWSQMIRNEQKTTILIKVVYQFLFTIKYSQLLYIIGIVYNYSINNSLLYFNKKVYSVRSFTLETQMRKFALLTTGVISSAYAYDHLSESYIFTRNLRTIRCGINILYSYKIAFDETNCMEIHQNIAKDIYETCRNNDGLYVKMGQSMAAMDHLLPPPFFKWFSKLQDKALASPIDKVKKLFEEQIGISVQEAFLEFDQQPIASASLAQVHKAVLKDGRKVAVKIQKPNIKKQFGSDMAMHWLINWVIQTAFDLPLLHFVDDIQLNLAKQLDFRIQAQNAKKGQNNFKKLNRHELHVPEIIDQFTRQRVMVSEWIQGIKVTDQEALKKLGFDQKAIVADIIKGFAQQIFVSGFIHCDPHPGNIFVRPDPKNPKKHQVVILDFGLCIDISDKFRQQYATFWKAMFLQDVSLMRKICEGWGMPYSDHFAGMTLMRPYSSNKLLTKKVEKKDIIKAQQQFKQKMRDLMQQTIHFPKQLLFISRNMNLVRSLNKYYGGQTDRISIMAKTAYIGSKIETGEGVERSWMYKFNSMMFSLRVLILQFFSWFVHKTSGKSLDEYIENEQHKHSQEVFQKYGFKPIDENTYNA